MSWNCLPENRKTPEKGAHLEKHTGKTKIKTINSTNESLPINMTQTFASGSLENTDVSAIVKVWNTPQW